MKGAFGKLAWVLLLCALVPVVIFFATGHSEAATTYVDGDLYITGMREFRGETWVVNGTVYVTDDARFTLDGAVLVINATVYSKNRIIVNTTAVFRAYGSVIRGAHMYGMGIHVYGAAVLDNTTLVNMDIAEHGGIYQPDGNILLDHCTLEGGSTAINSYSYITVRQTSFLNCSEGINWGYNTYDPANLVVKGCTFRNPSIAGSGLYLFGSGNVDVERHAVVSGCLFQRLESALICSEFQNYGSLLIEDNVAEECMLGCGISQGGAAVTAHRNRWEVTSSYGIYLYLTTGNFVNIDNETVIGGSYGVYVSGYYSYQTLYDMRLTGSGYGLYVSSASVDIHGSTIRSTNYNFYMQGSGYIHIFDCDHVYSGYVSSTGGEISEPVEVNITSVSWQDGTPITRGYTYFENETGEFLAQRDNEEPSPVMLPLWRMTRYSNFTVDTAVGMYETDGLEFRSAPFAFKGLDRYDLVIVDNSTPEVTVGHPKGGDRFERNTLLTRGTFSERGSGMGTVRVSHDGSSWIVGKLFDNLTWQARVDDIPDGLISFRVNVTDRAGNSREVVVRNVTIDTMWPFIEVLAPGKYVRSTPMQLVGRTEAGARAWVNHQPVEVMPDGMFSALLTFHEYETLVHIRVVDVVGHENITMYRVIYDGTAPPLLVDTPTDGQWVSSQSVLVTGSSESDAKVTVNGHTGELEYGRFSIPVPLEEGTAILTIVAEDLAGNRATVTRTVHVDRTPPELTLLVPANGTSTNRDRIALAGEVGDVSAVTVRVGRMLADVLGGNWSIEVPLKVGANNMTIIAQDLAGNTAEMTTTVVLDTEAPTVAISVTIDEQTYSLESVPEWTSERSFSWELEVDERVMLRISGGTPFPAGPGTFSRSVIMEPGRNSVTILVSDLVGNAADPIAISIQMDETPPELTVEGLADIQRAKGDHFLVRGTTEPGCQVTVNGIPATVLENGVFAVMVPLEQGPNSLQVVTQDAAGNVASKTMQVIMEETSEEGGVSATVAAVTGAVAGLIAGLVVALLVVMLGRRKRGPASDAEGPQEEGAGPTAGEGEAATSYTADGDDWEML